MIREECTECKFYINNDCIKFLLPPPGDYKKCLYFDTGKQSKNKDEKLVD